MRINSEILENLKKYTIRQRVIKNHYPWKYWITNKNLFIQITFWVWICWFLMAISAIFIPVNNQPKLGRGAVIVFESTFTYISKILGTHKNVTNPSENISHPFWNYEAYMFVYLTGFLVILSVYCFFLIKSFLMDMNAILADLNETKWQIKMFFFLRLVKFLIIFGVLLVIWSAFTLLYMKKPVDDNIGTLLFRAVEQSQSSQASLKIYHRSLTLVGWITASLNIGFFAMIFLLYFKYSRELFFNNLFFFKIFRDTKVKQILSDDNEGLAKLVAKNELELRKKHDFRKDNTPGYVAELKGVNKYFAIDNGFFHALKDVNLDIKNGEFVVILGYSGSGKTTLLNILAGIDRPTTGDCVISDCNTVVMNDENLNLFRRKKIGYIFQNYALLPNLTVQENIAITQNMDGLSFGEKFRNFRDSFTKSKYVFERIKIFFGFLKDVFLFQPRDEELKSLMEYLNLLEHKDKYPNQLSGGQQQRVSIARALIKKPSILLADEPTGAIDYAMTRSILDLFYQINEYLHTTVILITHNPLIAKMAKRILYVEDGKIVKDVINKHPKKPNEIEGL